VKGLLFNSNSTVLLFRRLKQIVLIAAMAVSLALPLNAATKASGQGPIQHVIYIQFDNTHLLRDNPNVPSDLEQMPHLLNFIVNNGTLLSNDHTVLISHTAGGILSSLTGVLPWPSWPDYLEQLCANVYERRIFVSKLVWPLD